jgi:outer membrane cobalamin receptor
MQLAVRAETVSVTAFETATLIQPETTGTRTELSAQAIERMPVPAGGRGLEQVLLSFPGFAADANGSIHPRGAHNQMQYVIDGMAITDQLTGAFGTAIDPSMVQNIELFTGDIPAEYGAKISGVANITTKSGLGTGRRFTGSVQLGAAQFDTLTQTSQFSGGTDRFGYYASFHTMKSNRFLDQVSIDNLHNGGNSQRAFSRFDYQSGNDTFRLNLLAGRSSFQLANLRSQHAAGQRQRQALEDFAVSTGWVRALSPRATVDTTISYRRSWADLLPSPGDTPVSASQSRRLDTFAVATRFNRIAGRHTWRTGVDYQRFPVREDFGFAITSPEFNNPGHDNYNPAVRPYDLSRGGSWFHYDGRQTGNLGSAFVQDRVRLNRLHLSLGVRYDDYRFLVRGSQVQPRLGVSFHLQETGTVLRASYNRTYQTPVNENLLFSNSEEAAQLTPPAVREALGGGLIRIRSQRQNVYEVGLQQALFGRASLNAVYYHKDERDLHDNDNFLNTGIIFPTSLARSRVNGAEARLVVPSHHGVSASLSLTHYRVIVTPPFTGGLFLGRGAIDALTAGPFLIDHDQTLGAHGMLSWQPRPELWISTSLRYDSGLVTNPSDPRQVATDPDYADLLPYVDLVSRPPRVNPRAITDVAIGYEHRVQDRRAWDLQVQISNLFNTTALYNFQSIFVGTRLVQPRTAGVKLRFFW